MTSCSFHSCAGPVKARGLCSKHYARLLRHGDPGVTIRRADRLTLEDAFLATMTEPPPESGCWDWRGGADGNGYGSITSRIYGGDRTHRISYRIFHGEIPDGAHILHSCDRPICVQPAHLRVGTHADNMADIVERTRHALGSARPNAKLTEDDVRAIKFSSDSYGTLATRYGVASSTIQNIFRGRTWRHVV